MSTTTVGAGSGTSRRAGAVSLRQIGITRQTGWAWYPGAIGPRYYWCRATSVSSSLASLSASALALDMAMSGGCCSPCSNAGRSPWHGRGFACYGRNVTIVNNANTSELFYRNARFNGAVTGLRAADFGRAGVCRNAFAFLIPRIFALRRSGEWWNAICPCFRQLFRARKPVATAGRNPVKQSRSGSGRSGTVVRLMVREITAAGGVSNRSRVRRRVGGNRSDVRMFSSERSTPQPVRISPQIVNKPVCGAGASGQRARRIRKLRGTEARRFWSSSPAAGSSGVPRPARRRLSRCSTVWRCTSWRWKRCPSRRRTSRRRPTPIAGTRDRNDFY